MNAELILNKFLKNYENRFLFILYAHGWAGSLVSRIIRSSHQYYKLEDDPLRFPDNVEGFPYVNVNNPQLNFRKQHLACVHAIPDRNLRYDMFTKEVTPRIGYAKEEINIQRAIRANKRVFERGARVAEEEFKRKAIEALDPKLDDAIKHKPTKPEEENR